MTKLQEEKKVDNDLKRVDIEVNNKSAADKSNFIDYDNMTSTSTDEENWTDIDREGSIKVLRRKQKKSVQKKVVNKDSENTGNRPKEINCDQCDYKVVNMVDLNKHKDTNHKSDRDKTRNGNNVKVCQQW